MKKIIVSILAMSLVVFSATAQKASKEDKMKGHKHHHQREMAFKQLNLSETQKQQMKANRESFKKQMQELNKNENITVKEFRDKKEALLKAQKEQMMSMLTPEQKTKLEQIKKDKKAQHEAMASQRMEKMKTTLGLSEEQVTKINANRTNVKEQMKAIKEDDKLSRTEKKEKMMALIEQNKNELKQFLTPEQITKLEEMKKKKMEKMNSK